MSLSFYFNNPCHRCGLPMVHATIDRHPAVRDLALHKFYCANCGPIKTEVLSLKPPIGTAREARELFGRPAGHPGPPRKRRSRLGPKRDGLGPT